MNYKKFLIFFTIIAQLIFVPSSVYAVGNVNISVGIGGQPPSSANYGPPQQAQYTFENLLNGLICGIIGISAIPGEDCIGFPFASSSSLRLYHELPGGGSLGMVTTGMVAMYQNPPTSTTMYLAHMGSNLGLVQPAYAAGPPSVPGSGSAVLVPILALWEISRNFAYLLFTVVFVVVGFMIMFRHRINPQTVVTVQQALPSLAIGLILVTFSYLIAALIVDLSFILTGFVSVIFTSLLPSDAGVAAINSSTNASGMFFNFFFRSGIITDTISGLYKQFVSVDTSSVFGFLKSIITSIVVLVGGNFLLPIVLIAVIVVAAFIQFLRLFWALLSAYINIFVFTILGPVIILYSSLPGQRGVLSYWIKNLLANVLVFPAVFAAFLFAAVILKNFDTVAPAAMPAFGGINDTLLKSILAIGIALGTPAIPGMIRDALGVKGLKGIPQQAAAGLAIGGTVGGIIGGSMYGKVGPVGLQFLRDNVSRKGLGKYLHPSSSVS